MSSAADFFGGSKPPRDPEKTAEIEAHTQLRESAFEERAVRDLLKRFDLNYKGWDVRETMGDRLRFPVFDSVHPGFPVRLGTRRLVAQFMKSRRRKNKDLAFHELQADALFKWEEFRQTQTFREWEVLKEDQSLDGRSVGLVFPCVGTLFIVHNWDTADFRLNGIWLTVLYGGLHLTVERDHQFLNTVAEYGWRP